MQLPSGDAYEGEFRRGDMDGSGVWRAAAGWVLAGVFEGGRPVEGELLQRSGEVWHCAFGAAVDPGRLDPAALGPEGLIECAAVGRFGEGWDGTREFSGHGAWRWSDGREFVGAFERGCPLRGKLRDLDRALYDVRCARPSRPPLSRTTATAERAGRGQVLWSSADFRGGVRACGAAGGGGGGGG